MSVETPERSRARPRGGFWRWQWDALRERLRSPRPDVRFDAVPHRVARPRGVEGELRITWVGHATVLVQSPSANLLFDPIWSRRASPVQWAGPARHAPPGVPLADLPPLDAVLVTHDHYDHLDRRTIEALAADVPAPVFVTPRGYREWMRARGAGKPRELAWWETFDLGDSCRGAQGDGSERAAGRVTTVPVRHWSRRSPLGFNRRLWCAYFVETGGFRLFFCGDSGYFDGLRAIGRRLAPLDLAILPIGAYEPRWFMRDYHMNPEEAVQAYRALGGAGVCMGVHWGTFVLADEPLDEPPVRMRAAWSAAKLPAGRLWIPRHGETRVIPVRSAGAAAAPGPAGDAFSDPPAPRPGAAPGGSLDALPP